MKYVSTSGNTVSRKQLLNRLDRYGRQEILSLFLIPTTFLLWILLSSQKIGWFCLICFVPAGVLLALGARYWRAKSDAIRGIGSGLESLLSFAMSSQSVIRAGVFLTAALCIVDLIFFRLSQSTGDRLGGLIATVLGILEYVNYFEVQLQYFDNANDLKRLMAGRGFRKSHLRRDLDIYFKRNRPLTNKDG